MQRVYACLTEQHDLRLVFLAGLICIAACLISLNLFVRANDAERGRPLSWLFVAATVFGAGVWATHFIAELAYEPGFPIGYDAGLTAISLVAAIGAVWLAMFVAHRFAAPVLGGAMIGAGIAAMHYIGMAALRAPAQLHWDAGYVLASVAIAMTFAAAAMRVSSWGPVLQGRLMAVVLLVLAIVGLHFTAMAAVTLVPDPLIAVPGHAVAPTVLAVAIATVMALIAALGLLGVIVDELALGARRSGSGAARTIWRARSGSPIPAASNRICGLAPSNGSAKPTGSSVSIRICPRPWGKLSSLSFIPTIAPRVKRRDPLTKPPPRASFMTCRASTSGFASSSLGAR